ncbi:MAG: 50S ribosomal protein L15 [Actinobacteria bacterium]|nr:50S ribosomal protein L15 [Actinomycetota bacterium]
MRLCDLKPACGSVKKEKRVGRGEGSGHGKTSGRGHKGHLARSGGSTRPGFEGGQMPLQRRVPHLRGFKNTRKIEFNILNVEDLNRFDSGTVVDFKLLEESGLIKKKYSPLKILGDGELNKSLVVKANYFSKAAREKIEKVGGRAEVV